jgi:hypothetical protein
MTCARRELWHRWWRRGRSCDGAAAARGGLPSPCAHVARAAGEGSRSDAEAWRDEANELKEPWRRLDGGAWMAAIGFDV